MSGAVVLAAGAGGDAGGGAPGAGAWSGEDAHAVDGWMLIVDACACLVRVWVRVAGDCGVRVRARVRRGKEEGGERGWRQRQSSDWIAGCEKTRQEAVRCVHSRTKTDVIMDRGNTGGDGQGACARQGVRSRRRSLCAPCETLLRATLYEWTSGQLQRAGGRARRCAPSLALGARELGLVNLRHLPLPLALQPCTPSAVEMSAGTCKHRAGQQFTDHDSWMRFQPLMMNCTPVISPWRPLLKERSQCMMVLSFRENKST
eukprot:1423509-Rhodomonas_salina.5